MPRLPFSWPSAPPCSLPPRGCVRTEPPQIPAPSPGSGPGSMELTSNSNDPTISGGNLQAGTAHHEIPPVIKKRVMERPDAFRTLAGLDDRSLDKLLAQIKPRTGRRKRATV